MPDISMCANKKCPLREQCYRFTAKANELWQAYGNFQFIVKEDKVECDNFWGNEQYKKWEVIKK